ncbi:MAG TPA: iron-sulfur cluster assembly scaffold protein [Candidatus Baltobacteraceae bacterium]|nr:iron-sulfur cluster assembly scaffold protein [Candidatus Baltobacteraceae bacterium]
MNFPKFQRLVEDRTGFRTMENATASGEYFSDSCGDMYNFFLKVGPGAVIEDISYFTTGCGFGTATCSLVVDLAKGKTIDEAAAIGADDIESALDGYPEKKKDYPQRALEALHVALDDYRQKVASGSIPDYGAMPAPERQAESVAQTAPPEPPQTEDGKLLIKLR